VTDVAESVKDVRFRTTGGVHRVDAPGLIFVNFYWVKK